MTDQQDLVDRQRGEKSATQARHTRELAELISRQADEQSAQEARHHRELARLWLRQGRRPAGWMTRALFKGTPNQ